MLCHQLKMVISWLENITDSNIYLQYMEDGFAIIKLYKQLEDAEILIKSDIISSLDLLCKQPLQKIINENKSNKLKRQVIVGHEEEDKEFIINKRGGKFKGVVQRPCRIHLTTFIQVKSKGSKDSANKIVENPINIYFQTKINLGTIFEWDKNQSFEARLTLIFETRSPMWVYIEDEVDAKRWWSYLKCQTVMRDIPRLQEFVNRFAIDYKKRLVYQFYRKMQLEVQIINIEKKFSAKFDNRERKFIENIDQTILRLLIVQRWKNRSNDHFIKEQEQKQSHKIELNIPKLGVIKDTKIVNVKCMWINSNDQLFEMIQRWLQKSSETYKSVEKYRNQQENVQRKSYFYQPNQRNQNNFNGCIGEDEIDDFFLGSDDYDDSCSESQSQLQDHQQKNIHLTNIGSPNMQYIKKFEPQTTFYTTEQKDFRDIKITQSTEFQSNISLVSRRQAQMTQNDQYLPILLLFDQIRNKRDLRGLQDNLTVNFELSPFPLFSIIDKGANGYVCQNGFATGLEGQIQYQQQEILRLYVSQRQIQLFFAAYADKPNTLTYAEFSTAVLPNSNKYSISEKSQSQRFLSYDLSAKTLPIYSHLLLDIFDYEEQFENTKQYQSSYSNFDLNEAFQLLDTQNNGYITLDVIQQHFAKLNLVASEEETIELIKYYDKNQDGVISLIEFKNGLSPHNF